MAGIAWTLHPALFYEKYGSVLVQLWDSGALRNLFVPVRRLSTTIGSAVSSAVGSRLASAAPEDVDERASSEFNLCPDTLPTEDAASHRANRELFESSAEPSTSQCNELAFQGDLYTIKRRQRKRKERLRLLRASRPKMDTAGTSGPRRRRSIISDTSKKKKTGHSWSKTIGTPLADLEGALPRHKAVTLSTSDMSRSSLDDKEDEDWYQENFSETFITDNDSLRRLKALSGGRHYSGTLPRERRLSGSSDSAYLEKEGEMGAELAGGATLDRADFSKLASKYSGASAVQVTTEDKHHKGAIGGFFEDILHEPPSSLTPVDYPLNTSNLMPPKARQKIKKDSKRTKSLGLEVDTRLDTTAADAESKKVPQMSGAGWPETKKGAGATASSEACVSEEYGRDPALAKTTSNASDYGPSKQKQNSESAKCAILAEAPRSQKVSEMKLSPGPDVDSNGSSHLALCADISTMKDKQEVRITDRTEGGGTSVAPGPVAPCEKSEHAAPGSNVSRRTRNERRSKSPGSSGVGVSQEVDKPDEVSKGSPQAIQNIASPKFKSKQRADRIIPHSTEVVTATTDPGLEAERKYLGQIMPTTKATKHKKKSGTSGKPSAYHQSNVKSNHGPNPQLGGSSQVKSDTIGPKVSDTAELITPPGPIDPVIDIKLRPDSSSRYSPKVAPSTHSSKRRKKARRGVHNTDSIEAAAASIEQGPDTNFEPSSTAAGSKPDGGNKTSKEVGTSKIVPNSDVVNMLLEVRYPVFKKSSDDGDELSTGDQPQLNDSLLPCDLWPLRATLDVEDKVDQPFREICSPQEDRLRQRLDTRNPSQQDSYASVSTDRLELVKQETNTTNWRGTSQFGNDCGSGVSSLREMVRPKKMPPQDMSKDQHNYQEIDWRSKASGASTTPSSTERFPSNLKQPTNPNGSASETVEVRPKKSLPSSSPTQLERNTTSSEAIAETPPVSVTQSPKVDSLSPSELPTDMKSSYRSTSSECLFENFIGSVHRESHDWIPPPGKGVSVSTSPSQETNTSSEATAETARRAEEMTQARVSSEKINDAHAGGSKKRVQKVVRKLGPSNRREDGATSGQGAFHRDGVLNSEVLQPAQSSLEGINKHMKTLQPEDDYDSSQGRLIFGSPDSVTVLSTGEVNILINTTTRKQRSMMWPFGGVPFS
ncbi:uncharacterized protein ISCGN_009883 [Ixodes scapularis]